MNNVKNPKDIRGVSFSIVRNIGTPKHCLVKDPKTEKEYSVQYQSIIYLKEYGMIHCINDGAHFTFLDPIKISPLDVITQRWFALCSCGAPAVIVGHNPLSKKTSEEGHWWLACYNAMTFGKHADESRGY